MLSDPAMITGSAALGGLGSKISGGDFWQGFATGMAVGAFNHAMEHGFGGGEPKPPYSTKHNENMGKLADAMGLNLDVILTAYELGKIENGKILPLEKAVMKGIRIMGNATSLVSTLGNIQNLHENYKTNPVPAATKLGAGLFISRAHPYAQIAYGIGEVTGLNDMIFNQIPKIPAYTRSAINYGSNELSKVPQLQYQKLYFK